MPETSLSPDIGHNLSTDYAADEARRLAQDYAQHVADITALLEEARNVRPERVNDDDTAGVLSDLIKRMRDKTGQLEKFRVVEKEPHLRRGQAVDRFFADLLEKVERQKKADKPGAADILFALVDDFVQRKLRDEQRKRQEEYEAAQKAEREATAKRLADENAAREAAAAAERARKPENKDAHLDAAAAHATAALDARAEEDMARDKMHEAADANAAKPADMVRTRTANDVLITAAKENYAEVDEVDKLDMATLWPFVDDEAKIKALKSWAKTTQYKRPMAGARIGNRPKTVIR